MFFDRKSRGKWRQRCFGKQRAKKRERENRICSRSGGRIKVAAQGRRKNPIGNLGPVPGRNKIFRGSGVLTRAVESRRWRRRRAHWISDALRDRWSLGELARHWDPSQIRYSAGLGGGGGESRTVTAVKTSPHPTTSPNPAAGGGISATRPRF